MESSEEEEEAEWDSKHIESSRQSSTINMSSNSSKSSSGEVESVLQVITLSLFFHLLTTGVVRACCRVQCVSSVSRQPRHEGK